MTSDTVNVVSVVYNQEVGQVIATISQQYSIPIPISSEGTGNPNGFKVNGSGTQSDPYVLTANYVPAVVETAPIAKELTATGAAQELVTAGAA